MTTRYSNNDVRNAFAALVEEATACGIDASAWDVGMAGGSVRNYSLNGRGTGALTGNFGAIGTTAKEAVHTMNTARAAMALVRSVKG